MKRAGVSEIKVTLADVTPELRLLTVEVGGDYRLAQSVKRNDTAHEPAAILRTAIHVMRTRGR